MVIFQIKRFQDVVQLLIFYQKGIMPVEGSDFPVGTFRNMITDKPGLGTGKQKIGIDPDGQYPALDPGKCGGGTSPGSTQVMTIHGFR